VRKNARDAQLADGFAVFTQYSKNGGACFYALVFGVSGKDDPFPVQSREFYCAAAGVYAYYQS
jgi:hypothetical protein